MTLPPDVRWPDLEGEPPPPKKKRPSKLERRNYYIKKQKAYFRQKAQNRLAYLQQKAKNQLDMIRNWKIQWDREEVAYLKQRAKAYEAIVAADREWLRLENEREARIAAADEELKAVQRYYKEVHEKEERRNTGR